MKKVCFLFLLFIGALCSWQCKQAEKPINAFDVNTVAQFILYDRASVENYDQGLDRILQQRDSAQMPGLNLNAYVFFWGGEVGSLWQRVLCFYRPTDTPFQRAFFYEGEEHFTMDTLEPKLGLQLTQLAWELGPGVCMDQNKVKALLTTTMKDLLWCPQIGSAFIDSLNTQRTRTFDPVSQKEFAEALKKLKREMTEQKDPNVLFFRGEFTNGIWKATVRQYDHTGRFGIDLEYLNGKFAYHFGL